MKGSIKTRHEARVKIIKAMAHPSRLLIIDRLAEHEYCVCELQQMVGADMSTVSKHLSVLKNAGMQIAPSSYYAAKTRPPSARAIRDA